jgi:hypothetical protein
MSCKIDWCWGRLPDESDPTPQNGPQHVRVVMPAEDLFGRLGERAEFENSRVVDQDVWRAKNFLSFFKESGDIGR